MRAKKRIRVEFGEHSLAHVGFTKDVSLGGLFLAAAKSLPIGTRLHLRLSWGDDAFVVEGQVARQHVVHPTLRQVDTGGMGIRFMQPEELVRDLVPSGLRAPASHVVACADDSELESILAEQLSRGVLLVPAGDSNPDPGTTLEFEVRRGAGNVATGHGVVIQRLEHGAGGGPALLLEVSDRELIERVQALLGAG